jgi:MFS family permease
MGYVISKYGRRKTILGGIALMGMSFIAFGLLTFIDVSTTRNYYIAAALASRFCQGVGSVCI